MTYLGLMEIANVYMQKIGFGEQPYLVYRHYDAGHPHVHIVSTNIRWDGSELKLVSETGGKIAGYGLTGASAMFTVINAETKYGHLRNSDKADLGVDIAEGVLASFEVSSPIGWAFGIGMFVGDLISEHYTGKSITENLFANDNN